MADSWESLPGSGLKTKVFALEFVGLIRLTLPLHNFRPEIRRDYPPNLSILISGGKENNCDGLSNGE